MSDCHPRVLGLCVLSSDAGYPLSSLLICTTRNLTGGGAVGGGAVGMDEAEGMGG